MGEVLQSKCSFFFAKNVCIDYILSQNAGGSKMEVVQLEFSGIRYVPSHTKLILLILKSTVNADNTSVRAPRKNPSIFINITLPVIKLEKLRRRALRQYLSQRVKWFTTFEIALREIFNSC